MLRADQLADLHERTDQAYAGEILTMRFAEFLPLTDVGDKRARAYHIFERRARLVQRFFDLLEDVGRLRIDVADADHVALLVAGANPAGSTGQKIVSLLPSLSILNLGTRTVRLAGELVILPAAFVTTTE